MQITDEMVNRAQIKYRELAERHHWHSSWPDSDAMGEILTAALAHGEPVKPCDPRECFCSPHDDPAVECPYSSHPAPQPSEPVQVKPLEWVSSGYGVTATTILGKYWVADGQFWSPGCSVSHPYRTDADAIAGAEAHYERRIRAALTAALAHGEPVAGGAANTAEEIILRVRRLIVEENKHAAQMAIDGNSTRDEANACLAALVNFTTADCDNALRLVKRRRSTHPAPQPSGPVQVQSGQKECATEGCSQPAVFRIEWAGVGSQYCHDCYTRVRALPAALTAGEPAQVPSEWQPVAWWVHDFHIAQHPVKARGKFPEPTEYFYPAYREQDAKDTARIMGAECTPLYASPPAGGGE